MDLPRRRPEIPPSGDTGAMKNYNQFHRHITVDREVGDELKAVARARKRRLSAVITEILRGWLEAEKQRLRE